MRPFSCTSVVLPTCGDLERSMSAIRIQSAGKDDARRLSAIGKSTFVETFGHLYRAEDLNAFLSENHSVDIYTALLASDAFANWLVFDENEVCGYAVVGPCNLPAPDMPEGSGELVRLYLNARVRGKGVGTELLSIALDWLERRHTNLYVSVYAENIRAQRLYARHGFQKILEYKYMIGKHADPEWIMARVRR